MHFGWILWNCKESLVANLVFSVKPGSLSPEVLECSPQVPSCAGPGGTGLESWHFGRLRQEHFELKACLVYRASSVSLLHGEVHIHTTVRTQQSPAW